MYIFGNPLNSHYPKINGNQWDYFNGKQWETLQRVHAKLELAHRLQTSKMFGNSSSLNTCQDDVNISNRFR